VFFDPRCVRPGLVRYYEQQFARRAWRKGAFRTIQDTRDNSIRDKLDRLMRPTLVVCGREDRIVDPYHVEELVRGLPNYTFEMLSDCGHAPQIECAEVVNPMVARFLSAGRYP
jgi:pimeloyl-ACP methyl ester carboxylesterase